MEGWDYTVVTVVVPPLFTFKSMLFTLFLLIFQDEIIYCVMIQLAIHNREFS
jgi:hypothetical protein